MVEIKQGLKYLKKRNKFLEEAERENIEEIEPEVEGFRVREGLKKEKKKSKKTVLATGSMEDNGDQKSSDPTDYEKEGRNSNANAQENENNSQGTEGFTNDELKSEFRTLEDDYSKHLKEYKSGYQDYAKTFEQSTDQEKGDKKKKIGLVNKKLSQIAQKMYSVVTKIKKDGKKLEKQGQKTLGSETQKMLKKAEKKMVQAAHLTDKQVVNTFDAFEADFKYRVASERIRYAIWGILAVILLLFSVLWVVHNVEFPKAVKIIMIGLASIVGLGFLASVWGVIVAYCQQAPKKGILCFIISILDKLLKGVFNFLNAMIS
jgi:membrane-associated HD superfamily phosphohydrolase